MSKTPSAGKGSKPRPFSDYEEYSNRWDSINWSNNKNKDDNGKQDTAEQPTKNNQRGRKISS